MTTFCLRSLRNFATLPKLILIIFLAGMFVFANRPAFAGAQSYWVAPAATGTGDGSSAFNAASYLNWTFWKSTVQTQLATTNVYVNFLAGAYNGAKSISFTNMGSPVFQLTLASSVPHGAVFSPTASILQLYGCQNFQVNGWVLNGPATNWGIYCIPNNFNPCRNIQITNCVFLNLTNAYYAAIGLLNGARDIQVLGCTFTNITNGGHAHMIYAPHDIVNVVVSNCVFQDCKADYVRFRDDAENCIVDHCTFVSTTAATAWPSVSSELYNETNADSAGDEFFANNIQVSNDSFNYEASGGPGPYAALHFSDTGWSPDTYYCDLTSAQASQLGSGNTSFQQSFMETNFGIIASNIKLFGNTYSGVSYHMEYEYETGGAAPYNGWANIPVNLNNAPDASGATLGPTPMVRNGDFDKRGHLIAQVSTGLKDYEFYFRNWMCGTKYSTNLLWQQGFDGTSNALRFDGTKSQEIYQWIYNPGPTWTMDFLFAIGSDWTGSGVKLTANVYHNEITGARVSVGVNNSGQFGIYNGGTFTTLPELGTVNFSSNVAGSTNYVDAGDTLNVYHMRLVGNYSAPTPYVDIYTSDASSLTLDHQSLGHTSWVSGNPVSGKSSPGTIAFLNATATVMLDQVSMTNWVRSIGTANIVGSYLQGNQFIITGTNSPGATLCVLAAIDLSTPLANWIRLSTNTIAGSNFSITNVVVPAALVKQRFYRLELQ